MKIDTVVEMNFVKNGNFNYIKKSITPPLIFLLLSVFLSWKMYEFPKSLFALKVFETDGIFTQIQMQTLLDGALFNKTDHLGFPYGFSQWSSPQFSFVDGLIFWILGKLFNFTNYGFLSIFGLITLFLNAVTYFWLAKVYKFNLFVQYLFGLAAVFNPYVLNSLMHPHVMKIFSIPIFLILIKYVISNRRFLTKEKFFLFFILLSISLFWINVFFAIFLISSIILYLLKIFGLGNYSNFQITSIKLLLLTSVILIFNSIFYLINKDITGQNGREAWHSDIFSGKFTDVLVSSPFLNQLFNSNFEKLKIGASAESWAMMLGISLSISFLFMFFIILSGNFIKLTQDLNFLILIATITFFLFITGGLSNLQAAFFVILNSESPMRAWSRLSILIASIGLLFIFSSLNNRKILSNFIVGFFTFTLLLDLIYLPRLFDAKQNWSQSEYFNSVNYIKENLKPCPILQIPIDTYLVPQGALDKATRYYWTNFIPYLLLHEFKWTAGTYVGTKGWQNLENLPTELSRSNFDELSKTYCAIYFDKNFSDYQIARKAGINFQEGVWPGLNISPDLKPNFEDSRFSLYLLNDFKKY